MSHRRRLARGTVTVFAAAALTLVSAPAWAHVEVESNRAYAGATDVTLTFHVPNELAPATTRSITFFFPIDHPLLGVTSSKQNGFSPKLSMAPLATAVQGPNGPVNEVVRSVEFTGGRLSGTEEKEFTFHVDQLPSDTPTLIFKALQKLSTGETLSWIEVAADGAAEPEHPAPVLALGPARATTQPTTASPTESPSQSPTASVALGTTGPPIAAAPPTDKAATGSSMAPVMAAATVGGLALAVGGWALWRRRQNPGNAP